MNIFEIFLPVKEQVAATSVEVAGHETRITALEGVGVVTQYTSNGTWTKPTVSPTTGDPYEPNDLFTVICINGGQGGAKGGTTAGAFHGGTPGGISGGYVSRQFKYQDLPSTVAMTIGGGGNGATSDSTVGAMGGATTFGSLVAGSPGVGAVYKDDGSYAVAIAPGDGGWGGVSDATNTIFRTGEPGKSGPFARGGLATAGTGGNGADAPAGIPSGGGGGAGGNGSTSSANAGGVGGFPGGGGGGGSQTQTLQANGGAGADGCIYVIAPF